MILTPEFWVAFSFVLLIALVGRWTFRQIATALDRRGDRIREEIEGAVRLREEAQNLLAQHQRRQREAGQEAEDIRKRAAEQAELIRARGVEALEQQIARQRKLAEEKIAQAEARAMAEIRSATVDLTIAAAARLIAERLDAASHNALIDDAIAAAGKRLH